MKHCIFIYHTLKNRHTLAKSLHESAAADHRPMQPAIVLRYQERSVSMHGLQWPTLFNMGLPSYVAGDVIEVNDKEYKELKEWEDNYRLVPVETNKGPAETFVFNRPNGKVV